MSNASTLAGLVGSVANIFTKNQTVPAGVVLDFAGATAPTGYLMCYGQAVSRTTYADLYAAISTTHGVGDGSTTFNLPDARGRAVAGKDDMGGTAANRLGITLSGTRASTSSGVITGLSATTALAVGMKATGTGIGASAVISSIDSGTQVTLSVNSSSTGTANIRFGVVDGATLGDAGGADTHTTTITQMPSHQHSSTYDLTAGSNTASQRVMSTSGGNGGGAFTIGATGGGQAHPNVQPTLVLNKIIKT